MARQRTLREHLAARLSMGDPHLAPRGSTIWLLMHGRPVVLTREQLEGALMAPEDRPVALGLAENWRLVGDTLTPVDE